mgnify:FL=1
MYVLIRDGSVHTFPYSFNMLKMANPRTSFNRQPSNKALESWGLYPVTIQDKPELNSTQKAVMNSTPELVDGVWTVGWGLENLSSEELDGLGEQVRAERDVLLQQTDFYALVDSTITDDMRTYRQALRDVPQQAGFPHTITWPTKP